MAHVKHSGRKNILSIGIALLFVLFIGYAMETFYDSPEYSDFCEEFKTAQFIETEEQCNDVGGEWSEIDRGPTRGEIVEPKQTGFCDRDFKCREDYDDSREEYNRIVFFISLAIGLITFVVAISLLADAVAIGFMGGGVLLIVYGTLRYWGSLSDIWRTIMLGFALGVLVWIGYKKLK